MAVVDKELTFRVHIDTSQAIKQIESAIDALEDLKQKLQELDESTDSGAG
jgi:hypothetical protein